MWGTPILLSAVKQARSLVLTPSEDAALAAARLKSAAPHWGAVYQHFS